MTRPYFIGNIGPDGPMFTWALRDNFVVTTANSLRDMAHDGVSTYVAIGDELSAIVSTDNGVTWQNVVPAGLDPADYNNKNFQCVRYVNGQFMIGGHIQEVGEDMQPIILVSSDGITWTIQTTGITPSGIQITINDIAFGAGLYCAVGGHTGGQVARIYTSPDSSTWTSRTPSGGDTIIAVEFGNGIFTTCGGSNSENSGEITTSSDGISWTTYSTAFDSPFTALAFDASTNTWVAIGPALGFNDVGIITSDDNWTTHTQTLINTQCVAATDGLFVTAGPDDQSTEVYTSTDGITWSGPTTIFPINTSQLRYLNGMFTYIVSQMTLIRSENADGISDLVPFLQRRTHNYIAANEDGDSVMSSTTSTEWFFQLGVSEQPFGNAWSFSTSNLSTIFPETVAGIDTPIAWANIKYILGLSFRQGTTETGLATSDDGITWTQVEGENTLDAGVTKLIYVESEATAVAIGIGLTDFDAKIITSSNGGTDWTSQTVPDNEPNIYLAGVAFGAGKYVATGTTADGSAGYIATSPDAVTWTRQTDLVDVQLYDLAYGNGVFLNLGYNVLTNEAALCKSTNGITFSATYPFPAGYSIQRITFANGFFFISGATADSDPWMVTTYNGTQFTTQAFDPASIISTGLNEVAYDGAHYIVVGSNNVVYTTDYFVQPTLNMADHSITTEGDTDAGTININFVDGVFQLYPTGTGGTTATIDSNSSPINTPVDLPEEWVTSDTRIFLTTPVNYEARLTVVSGFSSMASAPDIWFTMDSPPAFAHINQLVAPGTENAVWLIEVREVANPANIVSSTLTLSHTRTA
jgi:hypothetical protein